MSLEDQAREYFGRDWDATVKAALATDLSDAQYEIVATRLRDVRILKILHAAIGLQTEIGELMDALKRHLFYGKPLDETNLLEEGGDISWYLRLLSAQVGTKEFRQMILKNIEKLKARYPEKFTEEAALNRNLANERRILEGVVHYQCPKCSYVFDSRIEPLSCPNCAITFTHDTGVGFGFAMKLP